MGFLSAVFLFIFTKNLKHYGQNIGYWLSYRAPGTW